MAANEKLIRRLRIALEPVKRVKEKKMFSGITFMVNGKMCISVGPDRLMIRVDPQMHEQLMEIYGCLPVVMKERELKGYVYVSEEIIHTKKRLDYWVGLALAFNPKAKVSRKK